MTALFWTVSALIAFSLFGYGLLWIVLAAVFGRSAAITVETPLTATMIIAARNEAPVIEDKLRTVLAQDVGPHDLRVLVVSDGSEDATLDRVRGIDDPRLVAIETPTHGGKAHALNAGLARIDSEIVIFSDANSLLVPGALRALLAPFAIPGVGGVCGRPEPIRTGRTGWLERVEVLFWRYDSALKYAESRLGGAVSAQGTLYAMRQGDLPASVPEAMADDFYISVQAPAKGHRLVFAPDAVAREAVTTQTSREFMRRVRSSERGWRGILSMAGLLNPTRHGLYAVQLLCHKVLRRLVAFLLPLLFSINLFLLDAGTIYVVTLAAQAAGHAIGILALAGTRVSRLPGAGILAFFVMGHAAMGYGLLRASFGVRSARWSPVRSLD